MEDKFSILKEYKLYIGITGHRPLPKLGGYNNNTNQHGPIKLALTKLFLELKPTTVIVGMALGVDQWAAEVALDLKIPVMALIPCAGQDSMWPYPSRKYYKNLLKRIIKAKGTVIQLSKEPYKRELMHARNGEIVKRCDILIAVWDGTPGGTGNCVKQAEEVNKPIIKVHPRTLEVVNL